MNQMRILDWIDSSRLGRPAPTTSAGFFMRTPRVPRLLLHAVNSYQSRGIKRTDSVVHLSHDFYALTLSNELQSLILEWK